MRLIRFGILAVLLAKLVFGCNQKSDDAKKNSDTYQPRDHVELKHPEWSKNATIYEVNIRQYTPEGTFKAFEQHLPRLKKMGIDILWLMPVHPIGVEKRKGTLGSYYSVKDYYGINPEFGTEADFRALVDKIHSMGMYVIIDWVANHSAWDNPLVKQHPEWYTKAPDGNFQPTPWYDWEDIIYFDYDQPGIRKYMTDALTYWVREYNIDGYRCDVAGFMPVDFWENARAEMDAIKPVFLLAEWESRDLHKQAFDMTYSWSLWEKMHAVAKDKKPLGGIVEYMAHDVSTFPRNAYRMTFTENHDKNSWEGNQFSNFGAALEPSMVLACTVNGMPLVYSGQEAGLDRSLAFFEKDLIVWNDHKFADMYSALFKLKHENQALWNGVNGGEMIRIFNDKPNQVLSFFRQKNKNKVAVIVNYSDSACTVLLDSKYQADTYFDLFSGKEFVLETNQQLTMKPWEYLVLSK